jgi:hypothetical protein
LVSVRSAPILIHPLDIAGNLSDKPKLCDHHPGSTHKHRDKRRRLVSRLSNMVAGFLGEEVSEPAPTALPYRDAMVSPSEEAAADTAAGDGSSAVHSSWSGLSALLLPDFFILRQK